MDIAVPLISAALAGLVAWIVARHQGRTARENWVLDKRYPAYERVISQANVLTGVNGTEARLKAKADLLDYLKSLDLIAPLNVRAHSGAVLRLMPPEPDQPRVGSPLWPALDQLTDLLRNDLTPKHMR